MKKLFVTSALAAAAFGLAAPTQATVIDYTFAGDVTGTLDLNFDSTQPFSSAYTLNTYNLTANGITFTPPDVSQFYGVASSFYVLNISAPQGSLYLDFNPALTSQTAFGNFTPRGLDAESVDLTSITITRTVPATGAVPEPATWAMMLLGFGAIGWSMRYRRRKVNVIYGAA